MTNMDIKDLRDGMKRVDVTGVVESLEDERKVNLKTGDTARVRNVMVRDGSGVVKLVLWNEDIDRVAKDSLIAVSNGFTRTWKGELQLNVGRYGKLSVDAQ